MSDKYADAAAKKPRKDRSARATKQTPRERLIPGNQRVKAASGRTTWAVKAGTAGWADLLGSPDVKSIRATGTAAGQ